MLEIDLSGKVALVTGGSRGIGAAITRTLCSAGARVIFTHTGSPEHAFGVDALVAGVRDAGGQVEAVAIDAVDSAGTADLAGRIVGQYGKLDILVCNVGKNPARPAETVTDEEWSRLIDLNLTSVFYAVRAVLPPMIDAGYGRIILVGSSAAFDGGGGAIDYAAAKSGLVGMMLYLTKNYTRRGIITNTVHPCVIETDLLRERYSNEEDKAKLVSQIPAGRLGRPEDVAGMVAYLASSWGDYICGQSILLDGGRTLGR